MHTMSATPTVLNSVIMPEPAHVALEGTRFEDLYEREYPGLVAVATALSGHDGEDLVHRMRVSFVEAALGTEAVVPTLEGTAAVRIEPGTQPGATLRLRGEGMPRIRRRGRGDLKVVVDVMVPTRLTGEQRELLERFDAVSGEDTYSGSGGSFFDRLRGVFR